MVRPKAQTKKYSGVPSFWANFDTCGAKNSSTNALKIPPKVDVDLDKAEVIHSLSEATPTISGDEIFESKIAEYLNAKFEADALTKGANAILKELSTMYLDGHRSERFKMSISKCTRTGFNSTKFAEDYPELYKQYLQESEYTRTVVRRK